MNYKISYQEMERLGMEKLSKQLTTTLEEKRRQFLELKKQTSSKLRNKDPHRISTFLQIIFKKIESEAEFEAIKNLYLTAFSPNERREFDELKKQIYNDECNVNLILTDEKVVGFVIYWNFNDFVFLEHFAVEHGLRGLGIGEKTLAKIKVWFQKTVILETELLNNELNVRRIRFYERNGFHKLSRTYFQPSYGGKKPEVELKLMSTNVDFPSETLDKYILQIREKVYGAIS